MIDIFKEIVRLMEENISFAVATITEAKGSTPRTSGKMIILHNGKTIGTLGGGRAEQNIIEESIKALEMGISETVTTPVGVDCGGSITVFIEVIIRSPKLLLIGGGHVSLAIARAAELLNFSIEVVENREDYVTPERFPMAQKCHFAPDLSVAITKAEIDENTFIVIATDHSDSSTIRDVILSSACYIGMLGSKNKVQNLKADLLADGFSMNRISEIYTPVGLDLGGETPQEVAFSIVSEILMVKNNRTGKSLSSMLEPPNG